MDQRVTVVPWGNIEDATAPRQWGLKVGSAYVCRGREVLLFDSRERARSEAASLRRRITERPA